MANGPRPAFVTGPAVRLAVYTDYTYRRQDGAIYAERAFALFLGRLSELLGSMLVVGKVHPESGRARYPLPRTTEFVELPYYPSLAQPLSAFTAMVRSVVVFWRMLGRVDAVWLLGPHPLALVFGLLAALRRKSVCLGVRQDFPDYVRARHPTTRWLWVSADALEYAWRALARKMPMVAVGPVLASHYPPANTLEMSVSLIEEADIAPPEVEYRRAYEGPLQILSVGRLETEKNPLLLPSIAKLLLEDGRDWRLLICGEGSEAGELVKQCHALGVADHVDLLGYVTHDAGLRELYRESHALLHVSWTEGVPQVLFEAFAARLPVVATAVGGVEAVASGAALLVPPGDAIAAAEMLRRLCADATLRRELTDVGVERARNATVAIEVQRVAEFLRRRLQ